ncbi:hypothetical protein [Methyloversatilis universalis]|uniref:hypothetical protein n=1 Tax=Methyloversatilis universalis TaxID=378211 RepID=UPI00037B2B55|nr:hypothetical protein [Methyloversatilis universalis]
MRRDPLPGTGRRLLHRVGILAGWMLFAWLWSRVAFDLPDYSMLAWLVLTTLVLCPAITLYWVLHNLAIFRAKGARTHAVEASARYEQDWNGREVLADWPLLMQARITVIGVVDGRKVYRTLNRRTGQPPALERIFAKG